jgi:hypothetical protein
LIKIIYFIHTIPELISDSIEISNEFLGGDFEPTKTTNAGLQNYFGRKNVSSYIFIAANNQKPIECTDCI